MSRPVVVVLYVGAMVAIIVGVDFGFFRSRFWERLIVNIGIVSVFAASISHFSGVYSPRQNENSGDRSAYCAASHAEYAASAALAAARVVASCPSAI
jgi:hypothetical protein